MKNQRIIDRLWPRGGNFKKAWVPSRLKGSCLQCGRCCALIRISADLEFFLERMRHWVDYCKESGKPFPKSVLKEWEQNNFILKNWERLDRYEVVRRGFAEEISATDFFYTCHQLSSEGTCKVHDQERPLVCTGYPHYGKKEKGKAGLTKVMAGCGFARLRQEKGEEKLKVPGVLFLGEHPKGHKIPFDPSTLSGKRLRTMVAESKLSAEYLNLWESEQQQIEGTIGTKVLAQIIKHVTLGGKCVALGKRVHRSLTKIGFSISYLPHPGARRKVDLGTLKKGIQDLAK